ncbi:MAG TPA: MASE3 domain-containing protein [Tepidisphaeraceae bacterium]|nr:MASE3 domain-containing protein [Tepidisphaeraceae bacterium]
MEVPPHASVGDRVAGKTLRHPALKLTAQLVLGLLGVAGLYVAKAHSYLLFHAIVELFGIVVAGCIFVIAWNGRKLHASHPITLLGAAYLAIAVLDMLHMLSYRGMGVFPNIEANVATQLWIGSRMVLTASLLLFATVPNRRSWPLWTLGAYLGVTVLLLLSIFYWRSFPACFIDGHGLTPFKRGAEYACCALIVVAMVLLHRRRHEFDRQLIMLMQWAMGTGAAAGLAFTLYNDPYAIWNWTGHVLKVVSYFLAYEAIIVTAFDRPYALMFRDLSENERALRAATDAAQAANSAKDRFLAVLSHELRTPLAPVLLTISSLERDERLPPDARAALAVARRNVALETHLIDDLLDLNRVTAGKLVLQWQRLDLHRVVSDAVQHVADDARAKGVTIVLPPADAVAGAMQGVVVQGDPTRLQQVFWNLLRNAVKFSKTDGTITVRYARGRSGGGSIRVSITDDGIGIEAAALERIFRVFEQGSADVTRAFGGLGLGLSVARAIAELHSGMITATSDGLDRGATFTVELPCHPAAVDRTPNQPVDAAPTSSTDAAPTPLQKGLRLLVVEDHADTARALSLVLTRQGYHVQTAGNAAEARSAVASGEPFDLVLSDLGLPDATGYELMAELRQLHGLSGIAMSGFGMDDDIRKSRAAGFADHLTKPVAIDRLLDAIRRHGGG